ncbi:hypothetical protein DU52_06935 [Methanosarcina mazei]|uniref:Uncharacterized protein n=1 Tax=Methanosarcina mazei TaxID=2209 RepID=A0A0F8JZR6_METMZ|nr:hypothetical protein DU52_06935 [Methanosarcina mazei]KKG37011.1 hypothetical protein DU30_15455 [Methanosarcina mazei]KKG69095.1 hypothetical protein DU63_18210 [Methanosarcina mazei]KKG81143.1 hypothetical protein DU43_08585 [Methanosarcina mazei]KKH27864.1 hypothetical protein DU58_14145 [Methanosarcina mazei]
MGIKLFYRVYPEGKFFKTKIVFTAFFICFYRFLPAFYLLFIWVFRAVLNSDLRIIRFKEIQELLMYRFIYIPGSKKNIKI